MERFTEALEAVNGVVHQAPPAEVVADLVATGTSPSASWPAPGWTIWPNSSPPAGSNRFRRTCRWKTGWPTRAGYFDVDLGLTGAEAGFAESGSIVVRSGPGRPRMASLIPLVHAALLSKERVFRSLAHWAKEEAATVAAASNLVFITGPSRTGDIEQYLNLGVHGPKHVHVVLV